MFALNPRVLVVAGVIAFSVMAAVDAQAQVSLIIGQGSSTDPPLTGALEAWCKKAIDVTQGRVKCGVSAVRVERGEAFESLQAGQVDLAFIAHQDDLARFRVSRIAELPFLGDFSETVSVAYQRTYDRTPSMSDEHRGLKVLAVFAQSPGYLFTAGERLTSTSQLRSVRTVASSASAEAAARALHMDVVPVLDTAAGKDEQVVDAGLATARTRAGLTGAERLRTATMVAGGLFNTSYAFAMSERKWRELAPQDQRALIDISGVQAAAAFGRAFDAAEWKSNVKERANGVAFYAAGDKFVAQTRAALHAVDVAWLTAAKRAGLPNPRRALTEFRSEIARQELAE